MALQAKSVQFPATAVKTNLVAMTLRALKTNLSKPLQASYQSMRMSSLVLEN